MSSTVQYFSGDFMSSYTTAHEYTKNIRHFEQNTSQLIICGNVLVTNVTYYDNPPLPSLELPIKHGDELSFVEFRDHNPELSRRRNIFDYTISSLKISDFQEINGVPHGILTGKITGCLVKKEIKETNQDPPLSSETVVENFSTYSSHINPTQLSERKGCGANPILNSSSLGRNNGCGRFLPNTGIANRGCGNMAIPGVMPNGCRNSGCWSILSYLIWVPLLFSLFKYCDNSDHEDRNMPKVEDNKKDYWEENSEEDFGIDSTKILDNTYEIQYKSILLPNVQFFTNSDRILEYSKKELDELSLYFNENKELKGIVFGYTDAKGNKEKNQRLSQKRAEAVMNYLIERGVESSRLTAIGKGESDPRASNKLKEGRLMNRRVEITIVKKVRRK